MTTPQTAPANKRRARRRTAKGTTKVTCYGNPLGLGPNVAKTILDMSETGIRLLLKTQLKLGQGVEIDLESSALKPVKILASVVWVVPAADGQFCTGFKFEKTLAWLDLLNLARP